MSREIAGYTIFTVQEVMDMPRNPQPCFVNDFVYKGGRTAVVGRPWSGKSWFSLGLGLSVATGNEFLGHKVTQGRVLYVLYDRRNMIEVLHRLNQIQSMKTDNFFYVPMQGTALNEPEGFRAYKEIATTIVPDLTIIDHKSAAFAGDENDSEPNRIWINNLDEVSEICSGMSYLVVCQAPKNWKTKDISSLPSGHTKLAAWIDTIIALEPTAENYRKLQALSNNGDEIEPVVYTKDFQVIDDSGTREAIFNKALKLMRELWSVEPNAKKRAARVSREVPCGINVAWNAHKEVKLEDMEGTLDIHKHVDSQEE